MKIRPLNPDKQKVSEGLTRAFCATLPSERQVGEVTKAFCATLPGEPDATAVTKAFCATLPSEDEMRSKMDKALKEILKD